MGVGDIFEDPSRGSPPSLASFHSAYPTKRRCCYALAAVAVGVVIAGFWNYHAVDAFGREFLAEPIVGETGGLAGQFAILGPAFGVLFAVAAGLAATFTACNVVVFAMMPGLACNEDEAVDRRELVDLLGHFLAGVVGVGVIYGAIIGALGPDGVAALNEPATRLTQAQIVFSLLGSGLLIWGLSEMGFLSPVTERLDATTRTVLQQPITKASAMGILVGLFAVGRPFPVFREFLSYAASAQNPLYGAAVMSVHGIGMTLVMVVLLVVMVRVFGERLSNWVREDPHGPRILSGVALLGGGAYFVFYWGLALAFDIGMWGFKLGLYG